MRKVCMVIVDRANWGRLKPLAAAIRADDRLDLQIVCGGSTVLSRFKTPADDIERDGFTVNERLWHEVEGSTPETMARGVGLGVIEYTGAFQRLDPQIVLLIGDRSEALAAAVAAAYSNRCIVHIQGGEVSGSIDESARHAITKLAHYHVPATERAAAYIHRMGEPLKSILEFGCPGVDIEPRRKARPKRGELLVVYHPETTRLDSAREEMQEVLAGVSACAGRRHVYLFWPNIDAGADAISKAIRQSSVAYETVKNMPPEEYAGLLRDAGCAIGNSSSFVRDSARFGTPVVLVGSRQDGRERGKNVLRVEPESDEIAAAIRHQLEHGPYPPSDLYGTPGVSQRIVEALVTLTPYKQKRLHYA